MKRLLTLFMFLSIALTPVLYGCAPAATPPPPNPGAGHRSACADSAAGY